MAYERKEPKYISKGSGLTPRLPAEYQEVEYIENSGTQYITTPYNIEEGHIYKSKFRALSGVLYWKTFGGHYGNSSSDRFFTGICEYYGQARWGYGFGNDMNYTFGTPSLGVDYEAEVKLSNGSQYFILDGTELYTRSFSFSSSTQHTVAILASTNTDNSMTVWGPTRLYYWQLYDTSNNLQLDLIPCYRKADNVIGMYDLVNDVFYTNSGSGTFSKGADVINIPYKNIKKVYLGSTQIRPTGWQPGVNTIAYYPLDTDFSDSVSGNSLTGYNSATIGTLNGVSCLDLTATDSYLSGTVSALPQGSQVRTNMFWVNWNVTGGWGYCGYAYGQGTSQKADTIYTNSPITWSQYGGSASSGITPTAGTWYHIAVTIDGSTSQKIYVNGVLTGSSTETVNTDGTTLYLGRVTWDNTYLKGYMSKFIIEDRVWTAQEISDYYDLTKGDYGIS